MAFALICALTYILSTLSCDLRTCANADIWKAAQPYSNLSQALFASRDFACAEISLSPQSIAVLTSAQVANKVVIYAHSGVDLQIADVSVSGCLNITGATLTQAHNRTETFVVTGTLVLQEVNVTAFTVPFARVGGQIHLSRCRFEANTAETIVVFTGSVTVYMESVRISLNSAPFLRMQPSDFLNLPAAVTLIDCSFANNSVQTSLILINGYTGNVTIRAGDIQWNAGGFLSVAGERLVVVMDNCTFSHNANSILTGNLLRSQVSIRACIFRNNSSTAFDFPQFSGEFVFTASVLTAHRVKGPISLANRNMYTTCAVAVLNSTFASFDIFSQGPTPGLMSLRACNALVADVRVENVTIASSTNTNLLGFLYVNLGNLTATNVEIYNSGSTGFLICVMVGELRMDNFALYHPYTGSGLAVGTVVGTISCVNGVISNGAGFGSIAYRVFLKNPIYFGAMQAKADFRNLTFDGSMQQLGGIFASQYSSMTIVHVSAKNMWIGNIAGGLESEYAIRDVFVEYVNFTMYAFVASTTIGTVSDVTLRNCRFALRPMAPFLLVQKSDIVVKKMDVENVTADGFARVRHTNFTLIDANIVESRFMYLLIVPLLCRAHLHRITVRASPMQLFFDMSSAITISDAYFEGLYSPGLLVGGYGTQFTLSNTTFSRLTTQGALGKFQQDSNIRIEESRFSNVTCSDLQGWLIQGGSLTISDSRFADYHTVLFQVTSANVTIRNSLFLNGLNPTTSLISPTAYGGVLHCTDCPQVAITRLTVANVMASFGGALAFMRNKGQSFVNISQSEFTACRALQGGALFMQNVSFFIESSIFRQNVANTTGGALKAAIKPSQHAMIRHSMFTRNWATQGGGIEWSNAPVLLINTSFVENRADYGPDVASYGVALSSRLTRFQGNETTGSPIIVVFEFLDHYNHRVSLSPFVYARLSTSRSIGFNGNEIKMYRRGWFNYSDLVVYARPGASHTITATLNYSQEDYSLALVESVKVHFRNCTAGEVYHSDHCEFCSPGYFSFSPDDRNCRLCPGNATCPGGNQLSINPGFWTSSWNSTQVFACPLPSKCLGGPNSTCATGFTGKVCNECCAGAFRVRGIECVECWGSVGVAFQFIIPVALYVLFIMTVQRYSHTDHKSAKLFALKVCVSHFQLLCVPSYLRMSFTPAITYFLHGVSYVSSFSASDLPMHCFEIPSSAYSNAALCSFLPLLLICLSAIAYNGFGLMNKEYFWISVSSTLLLCPVISIQTLIPLLSCFQVDSEQALLFVDMQEVCWEGTHLKLVYAFVLPSLILTVAFPLAVGLVFGGCRPQAFDQYFPLWSSGYKWRGWEVLFCVTRCSLISLSILTLRSLNLVQLCYCFCALIVMCVLNVLFSRVVYINSRCFALCECSWSVLSLSTGFLSYFMEWQPGESKGEVFFVAMVLILNIGYVCLCACTFFRRDLRSPTTPCTSVDSVIDTVLKAPPPSLIIS